MWVYIYQSWTENSMQNAYIGEYRVPWSNTLAYYPLTSTSQWNDMKGSWTAYNLSYSTQAPTYWVNAWVDCANMTNAMLVNYSFNYQISNWYTANLWFYMNSYTGGTLVWLDTFSSPSQWQPNDFSTVELSWRPNSAYWFWVYTNTWWDKGITSWTHTPLSSWHNWVATYDWSNVKIYLDWELKATWSLTDTKTRTTIFLSWRGANNNSLRWYMSEVILESKARTDTEVSDYYNQTKANYWL